jgi:hypothetical protein
MSAPRDERALARTGQGLGDHAVSEKSPRALARRAARLFCRLSHRHRIVPQPAELAGITCECPADSAHEQVVSGHFHAGTDGI